MLILYPRFPISWECVKNKKKERYKKLISPKLRVQSPRVRNSHAGKQLLHDRNNFMLISHPIFLPNISGDYLGTQLSRP